MEIGESRVDEEDCKLPARPQHEQTSDETMATAKTESGIKMESCDRGVLTATMNASPSSGLLKRCGSSFGTTTSSEQRSLLKRIKLEDNDGDHTVSPDASKSQRCPPPVTLLTVSLSTSQNPPGSDRTLLGISSQKGKIPTLEVAVDHSKSDGLRSNHCSGDVSHVSHSNTDSNDSLSGNSSSPLLPPQSTAPPSSVAAPAAAPPPLVVPPPVTVIEKTSEVPLKATTFRHLQHKYSGELEYMLREFQKLESQLLGAKAAATATESVASRERREKLHSFIQHLEDTIQQIVTGVEVEAAGRSTSGTGGGSDPNDVTLSPNTTRDKEDEENVQKIEEHILANLLPVKVRLKKQLSAQQGAKHNPVGMPVVRGGGMVQADNMTKKATFLKAVPEHHVAQRRPSQYGKPLHGGGSCLTQKLHGSAIGGSTEAATTTSPPALAADAPTAGDAAASSSTNKSDKPKILFAGLALGSDQIESSVAAAASVHKMEIQCPTLLKVRSEAHLSIHHDTPVHSPRSVEHDDSKLDATVGTDAPWPTVDTTLSDDEDDFDAPDHIYSKHGTQLSLAAQAAILSYEEKRKARKKRRRKKKLLLLQQQQQQQQQQQLQQQQQQAATAAAAAVPKRKKIVKKRGPRNVEYMCALCNEVYSSTCDYNPWWALTQQDCPKCGKMQIPRIDIGAPANAIEYHPALLAHADEIGGVPVHTPEAVVLPAPVAPLQTSTTSASDVDDLLESDLSDDDGILSDDDDSFDCSDSDADDFPAFSVADQAENEKFGPEYDGPKLSEEHASRLLTLMLHATTCPCRHVNTEHQEVCRSVKYMMLHVRDCPGTTATFDVCPFPWCRKVKHLLYHLLSCSEPNNCMICSSVHLNRQMKRLRGLNTHRGEKYRAALIAKARDDALIKAKAKLALKAAVVESSTAGEAAQATATNADTVAELKMENENAPLNPETGSDAPVFDTNTTGATSGVDDTAAVFDQPPATAVTPDSLGHSEMESVAVVAASAGTDTSPSAMPSVSICQPIKMDDNEAQKLNDGAAVAASLLGELAKEEHLTSDPTPTDPVETGRTTDTAPQSTCSDGATSIRQDEKLTTAATELITEDSAAATTKGLVVVKAEDEDVALKSEEPVGVSIATSSSSCEAVKVNDNLDSTSAVQTAAL